jgi:hypothetical protein
MKELGARHVEVEVAQSGSASHGHRTLEEAVLDTGRQYCGGSPISTRAYDFWPTEGRKYYGYLYYGARSLLSHKAGNADEERYFSSSGFLLADKRSNTVDVAARMICHINERLLAKARCLDVDANQDADPLDEVFEKGYPDGDEA